MVSLPTTLVALLLLVLAGGLIAHHLRAWRNTKDSKLGDHELAFARRQMQRRLQASGMIGLVGLAMLCGQFVPRDWPRTIAMLWSGIMLVVLWVMLLAMADALATHQHFARIRRENLAEQAKLQAELRRLKSQQGNGRPARDESDLRK